MISDRDIWAAALLMVRRYKEDAMLEASERADQLLDESDMAGAETWHRIPVKLEAAVEFLQAGSLRCMVVAARLDLERKAS